MPAAFVSHPARSPSKHTQNGHNEFGGEAVLIFTLFLRSSDRVSDDYVKTRNISRTSKYSVSRSVASQAVAYLLILFAEQSAK